MLTPCQTTVIAIPASAYQYSFYTIIPDGWYYDQTTNTKKIPYIVDSGTTLCYLPPSKCCLCSPRLHFALARRDTRR